MADFAPGDKVSFLGWVGHVEAIMPNTDYPVKCVFKDESGLVDENFTDDGRLDIKHNKAALRLIERAKRVKKKLYQAIFLTHKDNSFYIPPRLFENEDEAVAHAGQAKFIQLIHDKEYLVEI
jgi:hypothetical protein